MPINNYIKQYLEYYIKKEKTEHAILLTGEWGVGKTFFIDDFIDKFNQPRNNSVILDGWKIIKVSLFGLNDTSEINEQIFQELHPILGSKQMKFLGNFLKGGLKLGMKVDLDALNNTTVSADLNGLFPKGGYKNKSNNIILVLDDLERSNINLKQLLGYINCLVEISKNKVIIVAEESYLTKQDQGLYLDFKEKVIGKTFYVKHQLEEILEKFLIKSNNQYLTDNLEKIVNLYLKLQCVNLRIIIQSIEDFCFITEELSKDFIQKHEDFYINFMKQFFILNFLVKKNLIKEEYFHETPDSLKQEMEKIDDELFHYQLFDFNYWYEILYKCYRNDLSDKITNSDFMKASNADHMSHVNTPLWLKLWNYRDLEDNDFITLIEQLENDLETFKESHFVEYVHQIALINYFNKKRLSNMSFEKIDEIVDQYIEKNKESPYWQNEAIGMDSFFNGTGYDFYDSNDPNFIKLKKKLYEEKNAAFKKGEQRRQQEILDNIIDLLAVGDLEFLKEKLLRQYQFTPILQNVDPKRFLSALLKIPNKKLIEVVQIINTRYSEDSYFNGRESYKHLKDEISFFKRLNTNLKEGYIEGELAQEYRKSHPVKSDSLKVFSESYINRIINLLEE